MADLGARVTGTAERLAQFHRVENTYLSTFQTLGGLGLLLGTFGLATVLLRNVLERKRELALLGAVGYRRAHVMTMVMAENVLLLVAGLAAGALSAALAIAPAVAERGSRLPFTSGSALLHGRGARDRFVILGSRNESSDALAAARIPSIGVADEADPGSGGIDLRARNRSAGGGTLAAVARSDAQRHQLREEPPRAVVDHAERNLEARDARALRLRRPIVWGDHVFLNVGEGLEPRALGGGSHERRRFAGSVRSATAIAA